MSSHEEHAQQGFLEEWLLDFADYSKRHLRVILKRLPRVDAKKLILIHTNRVQTFFWEKKPVGTRQIFDAIKHNPFIETLELSNDFVKSFSRPMTRQRLYINARQLAHMKGLKHLILHNHEWDTLFVHSLFAFLVDETCRLETLEFKHPLSDSDYQQLLAHLQKAPSLTICKGINFKIERPPMPLRELTDTCSRCE
ncbi:hypothetical protein [Legionella sp. CNM-4043-24]|uniref:hypothetical protein n=1 Tax=Legionella sp. CNM-4043-24 TaxID=3421646 RepID=UPI00403AE6AD